MRKEAVLAVVTLVALMAVAVWFRGGGETESAKVTNANAPAKADVLPAQAVLRISPGSRASSRTEVPSFVPPLSTDLAQLRDRRDWPALFQRVKNGPQTPEAMYIQAELIRACSRVAPKMPVAGAGAPATMPPAPSSAEERRQKFAATIPENDPFKTQRLAAYDKVSVDVCGELSGMGLNRDTAKSLMADAATGGNARARAERLVDDIQRAAQEAAQRDRPDMPRGAMSRMPVTDEQFRELTELLSSRDARVLSELRGVISSSWQDASLRIGSDQQPVDPRAMYAALQLLSCDLGSPCDAESQTVLQRCAYQSQCAAASVGDQVYYYDASPHQAQLIDRYRQNLLEMMKSGDFSSLRIVRGPQNNSSAFIFGSGRGP